MSFTAFFSLLVTDGVVLDVGFGLDHDPFELAQLRKVVGEEVLSAVAAMNEESVETVANSV